MAERVTYRICGDSLGDQIAGFRRGWTQCCGESGVTLRPQAVEALDAIFASFEAQARRLERGEPEIAAEDAAAEAAACAEEAERIERFLERLHARWNPPAANVVRFRPRPAARGWEGGGDDCA